MAKNPKVIDGSGGRNIINLPAGEKARDAVDTGGKAAAATSASAGSGSDAAAAKGGQP